MRRICISLIVLSAFIIASTFAQLDQCVCSYCLECVDNCEAQLKKVVEACEGVDTECVEETAEEYYIDCLVCTPWLCNGINLPECMVE